MEKQIKRKKNGTVELLRFLFCICILLFHIEKYLFGEPSLKDGIHVALFPHGSIGVEFFFLVSGYLMASAIYKSRKMSCSENLSTMTLGFMKKKYISIFPYHVVALFATFFVDCIIKNWGITEIVRRTAEIVPSLFLVQMSGISLYSPNHITWYLSVMLIAMFILYPLTYKYYDSFIKIVVPIVSLIILGGFVYQDHALTGVMVWKTIMFKGTIRGIIEVALGMLAFEISRYMKQQKFSSAQKFMLGFVEFCCYAGVFIFAIMTFTKKYEVLALFLLLVAIVITFSEVTHINWMDNKVCDFLGKISLPVYLCQLMAINLGVAYLSEYSPAVQVVIVTVMTFIFAGICQIAGDLIMKRINRRRTA